MKKREEWTWERIQSAWRDYDQYRLAVSAGDDRPLHQFLWHVTIDSQPDQLPFHRVWRPWQWERIKRRAPAIEAAAGKNIDYHGHLFSWETWPRGHDKTGETARMCVWFAAFAGRPVSGTVVASDAEQAGFLQQAAARCCDLNPWLKGHVRVQKDVIVGKMGNVTIRPYDASGSFGLTDDLIVCDELTWWKGKDLWDALISGVPKRPNGVMMVTTNAGILGSWQHEQFLMCCEDPLWTVFEAPQRTLLADWMKPEVVASVREKMSEQTARRVWDNEWVEATEQPLLSLDDILGCESSDCLWSQHPKGFACRPELYMGVDIGRTHDLTVIWTMEMVGDVLQTREIKRLENTPFHVQRDEIESRLTKDVVRCCIDQGSIGYELAEDFHRHFPSQVERVALGAGRQGQLGVRVREMMRGRKVRIPYDPGLRSSFQKIQAVETSPGGLPVIKTPRDSTGHCDDFWAFALCLGGVPSRPNPKPRSVAMGRRSGLVSAVAGGRRF